MEEVIDPKRVVFAIITSYPKWYTGQLRSIKHTGKIRGDLALAFFHEANKRGYRIVCADSKSAKSFQKEVSLIPNVKLIKSKIPGSGRNKRIAIREVVKLEGAEVIVLCEPEKVSLITDCLEQIVMPILNGSADIVVPKREEALFKSTYPDYMYQSEIEANRLFNEALKTNSFLNSRQSEFDHFFGPRVFKNDKKIISLFVRRYIFTGQTVVSSLFDPDIYSNAQYFPIVNALRKKLRVVEVTVPFKYPNVQKENEAVGDREAFINKRQFQRINILVDLMHLIGYLQHKRGSKLKIDIR